MFGKLMSISDELMWRYFELLSSEDMRTIEAWREETRAGANPRDMKIRLALETVTRFHNLAAAEQAHQSFVQRFRQHEIPTDMPEIELAGGDNGMPLPRILKEAGLTASTSEAIRLIKQGGVRIDGEKAENPALEILAGESRVYQVGKRKFMRIRIC
jgi:tyrosyl-tRNA synthetase